MLTKEEVV